jgi:hypothetical protein
MRIDFFEVDNFFRGENTLNCNIGYFILLFEECVGLEFFVEAMVVEPMLG